LRHNWPSIDVTRRSIEETAAKVINLLNEHKQAEAFPMSFILASGSASRRAILDGRRRSSFEIDPADVDEGAVKTSSG
jgi:hypothetical protein